MIWTFSHFNFRQQKSSFLLFFFFFLNGNDNKFQIIFSHPFSFAHSSKSYFLLRVFFSWNILIFFGINKLKIIMVLLLALNNLFSLHKKCFGFLLLEREKERREIDRPKKGVNCNSTAPMTNFYKWSNHVNDSVKHREKQKHRIGFKSLFFKCVCFQNFIISSVFTVDDSIVSCSLFVVNFRITLCRHLHKMHRQMMMVAFGFGRRFIRLFLQHSIKINVHTQHTQFLILFTRWCPCPKSKDNHTIRL